MAGEMKFKCVHCASEFIAPPARARHSGGKFCSHRCVAQYHNAIRDPDPISRFWSKVEKTDSCWLWKGTKTSDGYGQFNLKNRKILAHRFSYKLKYGPIPDHQQVLHNCPNGDNPTCVNPKHLWAGTQQENMQDCHAKGRYCCGERLAKSKRGENNPSCRLTQEQVIAMRRAHIKQEKSPKELAKEYGISQSYIYLLLRGKRWAHIIQTDRV